MNRVYELDISTARLRELLDQAHVRLEQDAVLHIVADPVQGTIRVESDEERSAAHRAKVWGGTKVQDVKTGQYL